jgi:hypothetical protein
MLNKESSAAQSDSRRLGDELNYKLDYEYAKGYAHRVSRIGTRYYQYDENGNLIVEQECLSTMAKQETATIQFLLYLTWEMEYT